MTRDFYNTWQDLARRASVDHDFEKLTRLVQQLNRALHEESNAERNRYRELVSPLPNVTVNVSPSDSGLWRSARAP
jgi:hypothetical protein